MKITNNLKNRSEELIAIAQNPQKWGNWGMLVDEEKKHNAFLLKSYKSVLWQYNKREGGHTLICIQYSNWIQRMNLKIYLFNLKNNFNQNFSKQYQRQTLNF